MTEKLSAALILPLLLLMPGLAHAAGNEPEQPVLGGLRAGIVPLALNIRDRAKAKALYAPGLLVEARVGDALSTAYATGIGVRGAWSLTYNFDLTTGERATNAQIWQGTLYWFHQLDSVRFALGPTVSQLLTEGVYPDEDPLLGAELSVDFRLAANQYDSCRTSWWFGILASHALSHHGESSYAPSDRETSLKLALSLDLESIPRVR
jgi:hypothetical protein